MKPSLQRTVVVCLGLGLFALLTLVAPHLAVAQLPPPFPNDGPRPGGEGPPPVDPKNPFAFEASLLPTTAQQEAKRKLSAALDRLNVPTIDPSEIELACRSLQAILDGPGDVFIYLPHKDKAGKETTVRVSARFEANRLLAELPPDARDIYETLYGAQAKARVDEARQQRDPLLLNEVVRRYLNTKAGADALVMLASHHLDRGQPGTAAFYFERLLQRQGSSQLPPMTLFKAVVAFHQSGDRANEKESWRLLTARLNNKPLRLGDRDVPLEQLQEAVNRMANGTVATHDWPLFRGDVLRSGRGHGDAPYLEPRWQATTVEMPEARSLLEMALRSNGDSLAPTLPGSFPIASGGRLVCRTAGGVAAFDLRTGQKLWQTPTDLKDKETLLSLENCFRDPSKKVQINSWVRQYGQPYGGPDMPFLPGGPGTPLPPPGGGGSTPNHFIPAHLYENTVLGTLSTDARHVYLVEDMPLQPPPVIMQQREIPVEQGGRPTPIGPFEKLLNHNKIVALDIETGKRVWEAGGGGKIPNNELLENFFLGPPLPLYGKLYTLAEKQGEVRLICLDPVKGDASWIQPLVILQNSKLPTDMGRRVQGLHLAYADGILVCPTAGGAVLGVDLLSRSLVWVDVYKERPPAGPDGPTDQTYEPPMPLSTHWKAAAPLIADGKVVVPCPDKELLVCLNLRDGTRLWKVNRADDDLFLGGVFGDSEPRLLIVGKTGCRAVSLKDGVTTLWTLPAVGMPSGHGVASGNLYYLPLRSGQLATIDVEKGEVVSWTDSRVGPVGNLVAHDGDILSQTATSVAAFPQLKVKLALVEEWVKKNPTDPLGLTERGELRLYKGNVLGAVADLREARKHQPPANLQPRLRGRLFDALTQLLQKKFSDGEQFLDEYRELCRIDVPDGTTPEERQKMLAEQERRETQMLCLVAHGREQQQRFEDAVAAYRDLYARGGNRLMRNLDDPKVQARLDVWVESRTRRLFAEAGPQRDKLEKSLVEEWKKLRSGDDPVARDRFVALFGSVGRAGQEARLDLAELLTADLERGRFADAERLLEQVRVHSGERDLAGRAVEALARLALRKGRPGDAADLYRTLGRDYADVAVRDGKTGADVLTEMSLDRRLLGLLDDRGTPWQRSKFQATEKPGQGGSQPMQQQLFTFEPRGPLPEALRQQMLQYHWNTSTFRLVDRQTGQTELWSYKPTLDASLQQYFRNGNLAPGRLGCLVEGRVAVVSLGHVIFGIDLVGRRPLWRKEVVEGRFNERAYYMDVSNVETGMQMFLMDQTGQGVNRLLGRIGCAGSGFVGIQTTGGLVVVDILRGETLWTRADVKADDVLFADDQHIFATSTGGPGSRVFRVIDGSEVKAPPFGQLVQSDRLQRLGGQVLVNETDKQGRVVLRLYDILGGKDLWTHVSPANTVVAQSEEPDYAAVVEPDGTARVFDLRQRKEVLKTEVERKHFDNLNVLRLVSDRSHFYLLPHAPTQPNDRMEGQAWSGAPTMRTVPVNGWLWALARTPDEQDWANEVKHQELILEQLDELPVLLFASMFHRIRNANTGEVDQILAAQAVDKWSGKRTFGNKDSVSKSVEYVNVGQGFQSVVIDQHAMTIDLIGYNVRIRHTQVPPK